MNPWVNEIMAEYIPISNKSIRLKEKKKNVSVKNSKTWKGLPLCSLARQRWSSFTVARSFAAWTLSMSSSSSRPALQTQTIFPLNPLWIFMHIYKGELCQNEHLFKSPALFQFGHNFREKFLLNNLNLKAVRWLSFCARADDLVQKSTN